MVNIKWSNKSSSLIFFFYIKTRGIETSGKGNTNLTNYFLDYKIPRKETASGNRRHLISNPVLHLPH